MTSLLRRALGTAQAVDPQTCRWDGVDLLQYKQEPGVPFKDITRQVLFHEDDLGCELRYFEVAAGGYSTLERHQHSHAVMILRGTGHCLVGASVLEVAAHDLLRIPGLTWHQFRADAGQVLGFLCMVNVERDRPQLPTAAELAQLRSDPRLSHFFAESTLA